MRKYKVSLLTLFIAALLLLTCACAVQRVEPDETEVQTEDAGAEGETTEQIAEDTTETAETEPEPEPFVIPEFVNPLTGLGTETDVSKKRPVSIMVNNIYESLPQVGVSQADILFECLAEGGITRLMMITTEYEKLTKVGSIRSARDYYIDYSNGFDCIFVNAGGSTYAYNTFAQRGVNRIDAVNGPAYLYSGTGTFIRDSERLANFATEHTLVVQSGQGLVNAINYYKYRTEKNAGYEEPMKFVDFEKTTTLENSANHAKVVMSAYQTVDYVYSPAQGGYLRYQFKGEPHIDSKNGEQLKFENVLILFTDTAAIPGDEKARINITTTGSGSGWYLTCGTYQKITWKKDSYAFSPQILL